MRSYMHVAMMCVCVNWVHTERPKHIDKRSRKEKETEKEVAVNWIDQYFSLSLPFHVPTP